MNVGTSTTSTDEGNGNFQPEAMLMDHKGSPRGRRVWNRPPANRPSRLKRCLCSNMAHPARTQGSPRPAADQEQKVKYTPRLQPSSLPDRRTAPIIYPLPVPLSPTPSPHSFSNPPALFIILFSSPDVRWSGFSFRSRAIASTFPRCLATSLDRYPTSPSDKNLGAPRLLLSPEIFSSPGDANNQLGNCTKNFIKFHAYLPQPNLVA